MNIEYGPLTLSEPSVYLGGPIAGLTYDEANAWRVDAAHKFDAYGIRVRSPLREKMGVLQNKGKLTGGYEDSIFTRKRTIYNRDYNDVRLSTGVLFYYPPPNISYGTDIEIGWATAFGKPTVLVIPKEFEYLHDHPFNHSLPVLLVETIDEGIQFLVSTLLGGL